MLWYNTSKHAGEYIWRALMKIKPSQKQVDFLSWEFGVFFHFGIRTFYEGHKDWDMKEMPLSGFYPAKLDCEQWTRTAAEAGAKYAVFVCKHHDGFANWPSKYTDYSVAGTTWKNGRGDVVDEFVAACRKTGLKVGLYYSPAEFASKDKAAKDYDQYFINQISELLGNYGKIDYLWFDGCGSENHQYDTVRIVQAIRSLQPDILLFNMWDPDTRWVGNESGYAHSPNPLVVNSLDFSVFTEVKDKIESRLLPVECDFRMRRHNWFYSDQDESTVKTLDELMGIYYYSVGRGANLLINIGPDRDGLLPRRDCERLLEFGAEIRRRFSCPVSANFSYSDGAYVVTLEEPALINHVILKEKPDEWGAVTRFTIRAYPYTYGAPITVFEGHSIGSKAICPFPGFYTNKIEVLAEEAVPGEAIASMSVYFSKGL